MTINRPHILICGVMRSGGSLVARLFDWHPDLLVMPMEMKYDLGVGWIHGEELQELIRKRDIDSVLSKFKLRTYRNIFKNEGRERNDQFNSNRFEKIVRQRLTNLDSWSYRDIINIVSDSCYQSWDRGQEFLEKNSPRFVVNHRSWMFISSPNVFFDHFPDGYIINTVREPYAWYASLKKYKSIPDNQYEIMTTNLFAWSEAVIRAMSYSGIITRYLFIKYEDLISDTRWQMKWLCEKIGIPFFDELLIPTIGGTCWLGNSSYGEKVGVTTTSKDTWKGILTRNEIAFIKTECRDLIDDLGYSESGDRKQPKYIKIPSLKSQFSICGARTEEIIREENVRLSKFMENQARIQVFNAYKSGAKHSGSGTGMGNIISQWLKKIRKK